MRGLFLLLPVLLALPAHAQLSPDSSGHRSSPAVAPATDPTHVRVSARVLVVDREALSRLGVGFDVTPHGRVRVSGGEARRVPAPIRAVIRAGGAGAHAFVEALRQSRLVRSEYTQNVLTLSGSEAEISGGSSLVGPYGQAASAGPQLRVTPTVRPDGMVHLRISAGVRDVAVGPYGYLRESSPAMVETEVVVRPGTETDLGSATVREETRQSGLLHLRSGEFSREVLVVVTPEIVPM